MRRRLIAKLVCAAVWASCACLGCSSSKSGDGAPGQASAEQEGVSVPDGTPDELAKCMRDAAAEVNRRVAKRSRSGGADDEELAQELLTGIKAAEKLMAHPDASTEQADDARKAKLALLYIAAREDAPRFENRLGEYVEELADQVPGTPLAAISSAAWIEVKHVSSDASPEIVLPLLSEYANKYPDREEGIMLFESYAESLARHGHRDAAMRCCRLGIEYYKDHPLVGRLRLKLSQIERGV